jgi:hypothetical protein
VAGDNLRPVSVQEIRTLTFQLFDDEPLIASMSLGMLESKAIALFVMKKMRKQKTCVNSDRKNIMVVFSGFVAKYQEMMGWAALCMGT